MTTFSDLATAEPGSDYRDVAVATICTKGGVSKTTTTAQIADGLARYGLRVLAIDLDANAGLSVIMNGVDETDSRSTGQFIEGTKTLDEVVVVPENWQPTAEVPWHYGGQLLPGGSVSLLPAPDNEGLARVTDQRGQDSEMRLFERLSEARLRDRYDAVLIDAPGSEGGPIYLALYAARFLLFPLRPESIDQRGWARTINLAFRFARRNPNFPTDPIGAFVTMQGRTTEHREVAAFGADWVRTAYNGVIPLLHPSIVSRAVIPEAVARMIPVARYERTRSSIERDKDAAIAAIYSKFALNVVARIAPERFDSIIEALELLEVPDRVAEVLLNDDLTNPDLVLAYSEDIPKKEGA